MIYLVGSNLEFEGVKTLVLNEIKFNKFSVNLAEFDALVLTSKNSVNALKFNQILPASLQICSIGDGTSRAASEFGLAQIYTAQNAHGNDFAAEIVPFLKGKKTLFLRARETASNVGEILRESGVNLTQIIAYENVFKPLNEEQKPPKNSVIIFTAPSAVRNFTRNFGWDESYKAVAIGLTTAKELGNFAVPAMSAQQNINSCVSLAKTLL
nr:uroporphyrinogen-III synthase [uncultured Campylobacter sp.]